jgi:hypothetical protein
MVLWIASKGILPPSSVLAVRGGRGGDGGVCVVQ